LRTVHPATPAGRGKDQDRAMAERRTHLANIPMRRRAPTVLPDGAARRHPSNQ
jgi:hypothetical protein